mmetsp:Transcript_44165/g.77000  ORF Transcript_44165/g.77000 Transcript_44165/m.77000 type:complete len:128 (+) Transcript_44165:306-689(+)
MYAAYRMKNTINNAEKYAQVIQGKVASKKKLQNMAKPGTKGTPQALKRLVSSISHLVSKPNLMPPIMANAQADDSPKKTTESVMTGSSSRRGDKMPWLKVKPAMHVVIMSNHTSTSTHGLRKAPPLP